jgi:hypothetical protein
VSFSKQLLHENIFLNRMITPVEDAPNGEADKPPETDKTRGKRS